MAASGLYEDIALRTGGDIYIGVVGPVRTGKSTFIKRFMETQVIPRIDDAYMRERARDELPQSGSGKTIMTAEPKFVPEEAVEIRLEGEARCSVRLIDCVGYMADGALGMYEEGVERMVDTPWDASPVTLKQAAETGTRKVIAEHSTIGIVVTTDGSVTDLPREAYEQTEARVITELKELEKPFIVLLNTAQPDSPEAMTLADQISEKYSVGCRPVNCMKMDEKEVEDIITSVLFEFPFYSLSVFLPAWVDALPAGHKIKNDIFADVRLCAGKLKKMRDVPAAAAGMETLGGAEKMTIRKTDLGTGTAEAEIELPRSMFYATLSEESGFDITDDGDLMSVLSDIAGSKSEYDRVAEALRSVRETGCGIVLPSSADMRLDEPEIVRHGNRCGVRLKAGAPCIYMMLANVETEVSPIMGGEKQSEGMLNYLIQQFEGDTAKIWESNIFGKPLYDLASEDISSKISAVPQDAVGKLRDTLQRIVNDGASGLLCIIL
ncbi:MAG: stage IV sporulation protein A [Oscillospiraceae bacterium]|nr:stage IV sporulation protein A [Oscillospiraceae bacterium]